MIPFDRLQLAAFDLDGVVADTEPLHKESKLRMLRGLGIEADTDMERYVGHPNSQYWTDMKALHPRITGTLEELEDAQGAGIIALLKEGRFRPSAGLLPLLERLEALGVRFPLFSSSNRAYVDGVLELFGLGRFFPVVIGGDEVPRRKPFPDGYERAALLAGADPGLSFAVEDSAAGVAAAKAAGLGAVGYRNPTSGSQDLSRADLVVDGLAEIIPLLP